VSLKNHSLRVALVWNGTVYQEKSFGQTSEHIVTVGDSEETTFNVPSEALPDEVEMFERSDDGYTLRFTDNLEGTITIGDEEFGVDEVIDQKAHRVDSVRTESGSADLYELEVRKGDWGLFAVGDIEIYFQVMGKPAVLAGRGFQGMDMPLVGTIAAAAVAHIIFLIVAFLTFDLQPELMSQQIPDRFVEFMVDDVEDPMEEEKQKKPEEDTTAKKAGGEEGKFGDPDKKMDESKVPKMDAEMKKKIDVKNLGVNKMLASKNLGSGALKNMFNNQNGISSKMNVAMSGEGSQLQVGRGAGGMGLRGTGSGGGGEGFGRVHGLGEVDTGGGQGTGAKLGTKQKRKVKPQMSRGTPTGSEFCKKGNIQNVVAAKKNAIQYCYERKLQQNPELKGKVKVQWKIGLDGTVNSASIASSTMGDRSVESCIMRVIKRMRFDKPDGGVCIIQYPFVFTGVN
jgi:outer membrane biosynthesis protein TonB